HGTQTGIAAKLKPWWMWVRLPPVLLPSRGRSGGGGRQPHLAGPLLRAMWVRFPPVTTDDSGITPRTRQLATRLPVKQPPSGALWVRLPPGALTMHRPATDEPSGP